MGTLRCRKVAVERSCLAREELAHRAPLWCSTVGIGVLNPLESSEPSPPNGKSSAEQVVNISTSHPNRGRFLRTMARIPAYSGPHLASFATPHVILPMLALVWLAAARAMAMHTNALFSGAISVSLATLSQASSCSSSPISRSSFTREWFLEADGTVGRRGKVCAISGKLDVDPCPGCWSWPQPADSVQPERRLT